MRCLSSIFLLCFSSLAAHERGSDFQRELDDYNLYYQNKVNVERDKDQQCPYCSEEYPYCDQAPHNHSYYPLPPDEP